MKTIYSAFFVSILAGCGGSDSTDSDTTNPGTSQFEAVDDTFEIEKNSVTVLNVLDNDIYPADSNISITFEAHDRLELVNGGIQYSAPSSDSFNFSFTYSIEDNDGNSDQAQIFIESETDNSVSGDLNPSNDSVITTANQSININVLKNDRSSTGDALSLTEIVRAPSNGVATIVDGHIQYLPDTNYSGTDWFTYGVTDESGNTIGGVSVNVLIEAKTDGRYTEFKLDNLKHYVLPEAGLMFEHGYTTNSTVETGSAGDFNGDSYQDFITCYPYNSVNNGDSLSVSAGECFITFGREMPANAESSIQSIVEETTVHVISNIDNAQLGTQVTAAGDVNGDGYDDILISSLEDDDLAPYVLLGSATTDDQVIISSLSAPQNPRVLTFSTAQDMHSASFIGDVNNDGYDDLAFSHSNASEATHADILLWFGGSEPGESELGNINLDNLSAPNDGFRYLQLDPNPAPFANEFVLGGAIQALGDVNGDDYDDFIVSVGDSRFIPRDDGAFIVMGRANYSGHSQFLSTESGIFINSEEELYPTGKLQFGYAGDFNDDGAVDLLVTRENDVLIYSLNGTTTGEILLENSERIITTVTNVGSMVDHMQNLRDINGDGIDDLIFFEHLEHRKPIVLIYGATSLPNEINIETLTLSNGADGSVGAIIHNFDIDAGEVIGSKVTPVGDFNDDGFNDFVIAGRGDIEQDQTGEASLIFGGPQWGGTQ